MGGARLHHVAGYPDSIPAHWVEGDAVERQPAPAPGEPELFRSLGTFDAVIIGLGSMIGAGVAGSGTHRRSRCRRRPLTTLNFTGIRKAAWVTTLIVAFVLAVHAAAVTACLTSAVSVPTQLSIRGEATVGDILQAAGLQFSAFAGYARIATLGEEVRTGCSASTSHPPPVVPSRQPPRAAGVTSASS